jgi:hypothetical protein
MIVFDTGDGIIIYKAILTAAEAAKMESLHNRYGGMAGMSAEEDGSSPTSRNRLATSPRSSTQPTLSWPRQVSLTPERESSSPGSYHEHLLVVLSEEEEEQDEHPDRTQSDLPIVANPRG